MSPSTTVEIDLGAAPLRRTALAPDATLAGLGSADHVLRDLLCLGAMACRAPVALVSVPVPSGEWRTLSYTLETCRQVDDGGLFGLLARSSGPVEVTDLLATLPHSDLVRAPDEMRWAYGVTLRDASGQPMGAVAVLDRCLRRLTKREVRALACLGRQLELCLVEWRSRVPAADAPADAGRVSSARTAYGRGAGLRSASGTPTLIGTKEVAGIFQVTARTVSNWVASGRLASSRTLGGQLRFRREDIERLRADVAMERTTATDQRLASTAVLR